MGLIAHVDDLIAGLPQAGDLAVVIGQTLGHMGQSALLAELGVEAGDAPSVDLDAERRNGTFLRDNRKLVRAATDLSDGGLALAAFELADAAGLGVALDAADLPTLFGEDQARYLLAIDPADLADLHARAGAAGVPLTVAGRFGDDFVALGGDSAPLADLSTLYRSAFAAALTQGAK